MDESILTTIKMLLGCTEEDTSYDSQIITDINSVFSILTQLGIGPKDGFIISDKSNVWSEFIDDKKELYMVKSYIYLKVKLMFDPPLSGGAMDVIERGIREFEWRLNSAIDYPSESEMK